MYASSSKRSIVIRDDELQGCCYTGHMDAAALCWSLGRKVDGCDVRKWPRYRSASSNCGHTLSHYLLCRTELTRIPSGKGSEYAS
jgi:hypothetical protein